MPQFSLALARFCNYATYRSPEPYKLLVPNLVLSFPLRGDEPPVPPGDPVAFRLAYKASRKQTTLGNPETH